MLRLINGMVLESYFNNEINWTSIIPSLGVLNALVPIW